MIVGTLKNNIQTSIILLLIISLGLWLGSFWFINTQPISINYKEHVLYSYFFETGFSLYVHQLITLSIILLGAFLVNFLAIEQEITSKTNNLPAFLYILFACSANTKIAIEPILTANIFIIPSIYFLINSYRKDYALSEFFKAGLLMGIASFFCIHYILIFPICFISLIILRSFNWREWVILIIGLLTPLYLYASISYLKTADAFFIFSMLKEATSNIQNPVISEYYVSFILISFLAIVFAITHYVGKGFGGKVKTQKTKYILIWMLFLSLLLLFFEQQSDMILLPCIIPISIIIGDYLSEIKQLKIANTLLFLIICSFLVIYLHALGII
jgi:hypothetical protein